MFDLESAIRHCEEVAEGNEDDAKEYDRLAKLETYPSRKECESAYKRCRKCAAEHRQLAEWLKDYKRLLAIEKGTDIRCGNCKHDGSDDGICEECFDYRRWEEI